MKFLAAVFSIVAALALASPAQAQDTAAIGDAEAAASKWLDAVDAGDFASSWQQSATLFQASVGKDKWQEAVRAAHDALGPVKTRKVESAVFARTLPGAPDGEYVVIHYHTQFANKDEATETVTPMREKDGTWKVSGYYVR